MNVPVVHLGDQPIVSLMRGDGWARCCICFAFHTAPYDQLAVDENGDRWDVCTGDCAHDAGITERTVDPPSDGVTV